MKTIALQAGLTKFLWKRNQLGHCRLSTMKTGIEACHLRHVWKTIDSGFDRREVVGLMQWGEWYQFPQLLQHLRVHYCWTFKTRAAMDHAMSDAKYTRPAVFRLQPRGQCIDRFASVTRSGGLVNEAFAVGVLHAQMRRCTDAFNLTARFETPAFTFRPLKN